MRKPHQHELGGKRTACTNPECRLPFKLTRPSQGSTRRGHARSYSAILGDHNKCECAYPGCPVHKGTSDCREFANVILYRVYMEDNTGTAMCEDCAEDALLSGLFTSEIEDDGATLRDEVQQSLLSNSDADYRDRD